MGIGRLPSALLHTGHQFVYRFADGQIKHFGAQGGIIAGGAAKADDFTVGKVEFACALRGIHHFGSAYIHHIQRHFGISHLRFAAAQNAEQLMIAHFFAAEFGNIAGDDITGAF